MPLEKKSNLTIAVIGGGRWGQVTLSVLAKMNLPYQYVVVSNANYYQVQSQLAAFESTASTFRLVRTVTDLLDLFEVNAAIIVNAARAHFDTAKKLLSYGIPVLIEKPVVLSMAEMKLLIQEASRKNLSIVPGLCYRFCSYVHHFALKVQEQGVPYQFVFEWSDANNEVRYGQKKRHDETINVVQDVLPHIGTILSIVFKLEIKIVLCQLQGDAAELDILMGDIRGSVILQRRNSRERKRYLSVEFVTGHSIALDFTTEPGLIIDGANTDSGDNDWSNQPSPLQQQLDHFFAVVNRHDMNQEDADACLRSVKWVEDANNA